MPMPRRLSAAAVPSLWPLTLFGPAVTRVLVPFGGGSSPSPRDDPGSEVSWAVLAGAPRPRVVVGQRMIVVLRTPSLAERVRAVGGIATDADQRRWVAEARAAQQL